MDGSDRNFSRICLEGDWSLNGVAQQFQLINQWFEALTAAGEKPAASELDLNEITDLDACGCQLLAIVMRNLRQCEIMPLCSHISESIGTKIRLLGFDHEFGLATDFSRDCA